MSRFRTVNIARAYNCTSRMPRGDRTRPAWDRSADQAWKDLPRGKQRFQGIPFALPDSARQNCLIALGRGAPRAEARIDGKATHVCILHFCDALPRHRKGTEVGTVLAEYTLSYRDGTQHTQEIRKRFEIDCFGAGRDRNNFTSVTHLGARVAQPEDGLPYGRVETGVANDGGRLLADIHALENPHPDRSIAAIAFAWKGSLSVAVLAVTLYNGPGHPLLLERRNLFSVTLPAAEKADAREVRAEVDLGHVTRVLSAPQAVQKSWLRDPNAGLGASPRSPGGRKFFIEATTARGATLQVKAGKHGRHAFPMEEVYAGGSARSADGAGRIELLHPRKTWVHVSVVDDSSGKPTPTRIHFAGPNGEYLPPHGHHSEVNTNWFEDYAGEVKLGDTDYAYVPGNFQIELPVGEVYVELSKGFEYAPVRKRIKVRPGQRELELRVGRRFDLRSEGWVTADTHVHFISPQTAWLEGQAEGLNLVNLLASQWGKMFTNVADITGEASGSSADDTIVWVGTENRHHLLGHISMLGARGEPVFPMCGGGPGEAYFGDPEFRLLAEWAQQCREQQGVSIRPHFPGPVAEDPSYIVLGLLDAAELRSYVGTSDDPLSSPALAEWYRYLNCGYRVSVAGGTDKMSAATPVGGSRTYAKLLPDQPFTFDAWGEAVRAGRTFVSNGPLIGMTVEGREVGEEISLPGGGGTLEIGAWATSVWPIRRLEIVVNGRVVDASTAGKGSSRLSLKSKIPFDSSSWVAARCVSDLQKQMWMMGAGPLGAHTSPVYVTVGGERPFNPTDAMYMLTLLEGSVAYLNTLGTRLSEGRHREMIELVERARESLRSRFA